MPARAIRCFPSSRWPRRRSAAKSSADDIDGFLSGDAAVDEATLCRLLVAVAQREHVPASMAQGFVDFQLTRGELGVST